MSRTVTVEGVTFKCPPYLVRAGIGWQVRAPGQATVYFADQKCGSSERAYRLATRHLAGLALVAPERLEQSTKGVKTGYPGLIVNFKPGRGRRADAAEFQIRVPGQPIRVIYIGTEQTYERNYPAKFQLALAELEARRRAQRIARSGQRIRSGFLAGFG